MDEEMVVVGGRVRDQKKDQSSSWQGYGCTLATSLRHRTAPRNIEYPCNAIKVIFDLVLREENRGFHNSDVYEVIITLLTISCNVWLYSI